MTRTSGKDGGTRNLVTGTLFALAVAVRALPWPSVLAPDGVHLASHDAWYHLRRVAWSIANSGRVLDFDPFLHFPAGARPIWPPAFDAFLAALLGIWVPPGDTAALERAAVWVPPLLGGLTVAVLTRVAWRNFGPTVAVVSGLVLALLPAHFWYSRLGYVDHHVAVALTAALGLGAALALARAAEPGGGRGAAAVCGYGAALAALLLLWPGSLLHAGLLDAGLIAHATGRATRDAAVSAARRLAAAHGLALALTLPFCLGNPWPQWGAFSPLVLSCFQPWWLVAVAVAAGLVALCWSRTAGGEGAWPRAASAVGIGGGILLGSLALWPEIGAGAVDALAWALRRDSFQARVAESQPLLVTAGRFAPGVALARLSPFFFVVPLVAPWLWWRARGRADAGRVGLVVVWSLGLLLATLAQRRFFHSFALGESLLLGLGWVEVERGWVERAGRAALGRVRAGLAFALALALLATLPSYRPFLARAAPGEPLQVSSATMKRRVTEDLALWLHENTPEVGGWLERGARPGYGVLAPWEAGHAIEYLGRRPTVIDNFGDDLGPENFERAGRYYASAEPEALEILATLGVRYVVTGPGAVTGAPAGPASMFRSLSVRDGAALEGADAPALERHRLVWDSPSLTPRDPTAPPFYKVFEVVAGARIEGQARAGERIDLDLALRTGRGRETGYRATTAADVNGRYAFRVPHPAPGGTRDVRATGPYRVRCGGIAIPVRVTQEDVTHGGTVRVRQPCP